MRAGRLRHRLTLQKYSYTQDELGQVVEEWVDSANIWASIEGINGREFLASSTEVAGTTWRITIRYRDGIDTKTNRLVDGERIFNITAALPDNKQQQLILMCESGVIQQ